MAGETEFQNQRQQPEKQQQIEQESAERRGAADRRRRQRNPRRQQRRDRYGEQDEHGSEHGDSAAGSGQVGPAQRDLRADGEDGVEPEPAPPAQQQIRLDPEPAEGEKRGAELKAERLEPAAWKGRERQRLGRQQEQRQEDDRRDAECDRRDADEEAADVLPEAPGIPFVGDPAEVSVLLRREQGEVRDPAFL